MRRSSVSSAVLALLASASLGLAVEARADPAPLDVPSTVGGARARAAARISADSTNAALWAEAAAVEDDPRDAEPLLREALRLDPDNVEALVALARIQLAADDPDGVDTLARAQRLRPNDLAVRLAAAEHAHDLAQALAIAQDWPNDPAPALLVARLGAPAVAVPILSRVPPDRQVLAARAALDLQLGDAADARAAVDALAAAFPRAPELPRLGRWLGCIDAGTITPETVARLEALRQHAAVAAPGAARAPTADPFAGTERCPAALALRATLQPERAIPSLQGALVAAPDDAELAERLGDALLDADRTSEAVPWLERAHAGRPWVAPLALARALHHLGDDDRARGLLADPAYAEDPAVGLLAAELAPTPADALDVLVRFAKATLDPSVVTRARDLAGTLDAEDRVAAELGASPADAAQSYGGDAAYEVVVVGDKASDQRLAELVDDLRALGYGRAKRRPNGDLVFEAVDVGHPRVALHRDGTFDVQTSGYVPTTDVVGSDSVLGNDVVRITPPIVSARKLKLHRMHIVDEITPELLAWRAALCAEQVEDRLLVEIPTRLDRAWRDGVPIDDQARADGGVLGTPDARRGALLDYWASRACNEEGARVRAAIARYLAAEVQPSPWPVTDAELAAVNARSPCDERLTLAMAAPVP